MHLFAPPSFLDAGESQRVFSFAVLAHLGVFPALVLGSVLSVLRLFFGKKATLLSLDVVFLRAVRGSGEPKV
jgi:hypothetical protein